MPPSSGVVPSRDAPRHTDHQPTSPAFNRTTNRVIRPYLLWLSSGSGRWLAPFGCGEKWGPHTSRPRPRVAPGRGQCGNMRLGCIRHCAFCSTFAAFIGDVTIHVGGGGGGGLAPTYTAPRVMDAPPYSWLDNLSPPLHDANEPRRPRGLDARSGRGIFFFL